jgi:hypothetical protein
MLEIANILQKEGVLFLDKGLAWGGKISDYRKEIEALRKEKPTAEIIAVELEVDDPVLQQDFKIRLIDHHNEYAHKPASIIQVLELLKKEPTRWHRLVAANDSRYIPGLIDFGASKEEIMQIRFKDRQAQGVKEADEASAEYSIKENLQYQGVHAIVKSLTPYFSTIVDRLYGRFESLIVYNDVTVAFYGYEIKKLELFLQAKGLQRSEYYFGGGKRGFAGVKKGVLLPGAIRKLSQSWFDKNLENCIKEE